MYADQNRVSVDKDKTVFEAIADNNDELQLGSRTVKSRAYLSWFNFKGGSQQKPISALSGGELNRLALAQVTKGGGNLLLGGKLTKVVFLHQDKGKVLRDANFCFYPICRTHGTH